MNSLVSRSNKLLNYNKKYLFNIYSLLSHNYSSLASINKICFKMNNNNLKCNNYKNNNSYLNTNNIYKILNKKYFSTNLPDHEIIGMPALSPSVEVSKIVEWKKQVGDLVKEDEAIAAVQTDKAVLDWRITDEVYLAKILLETDIEVAINHPVCIFVDNKEDVNAFTNYVHNDTSSTSSDTTTSTTDTTTTSTQTQTQTTNDLPSGLPEYKIEGMPALSPTATDGAIVEWLINEGDFVEEGTEMAQIQTDKSAVAWSAIDDGYLAKKLYSADSNNRFEVNHPIAVFVENKEDVEAFKNIDPNLFINPQSSQQQTQTTTTDTSSTPTQTIEADELETRGRVPSIQFRYGVRESPTPKSSVTKTSSGRIIASPYAKKLAKDNNLDLNLVQGTSVGGRIVARDVELALKEGVGTKQVSTTPTTTTTTTITGDRSYNDIPLTPMRSIIAQRLCESKFTSPHYYETIELEMDNLMEIRKQINENLDIKISVNDFIIKACSLALMDVPSVNASWIDNKFIREYNYIDISVAVATPGGLITPIIKDANLRGLYNISNTMKDLANRAKDNKLNLDEFQGGTFTISNLGMFGIKQFTAIINPPQSCILAVGGANQVIKPSNNNGYRTATVMHVTLSSDHRVVDGALAAQWLMAFKKYIESPAKMML